MLCGVLEDKMSKKLFLLLFIFVFLPAFAVLGAESESDSGAGSKLSLSYSDIFSAVTDGIPTVIAEKGELDGEKFVKIVPDTGSSLYKDTQNSKRVSLDSWGLSKHKIDMNVFTFVSVDYLYKSESPSDSYPMLHVLPQKVLKKRIDVTADAPLVQGKRSRMTFFVNSGNNISDLILTPDEPYYSQIHFFPFGDTTVNELHAKDELYIYSVTFWASDPIKDRSYTVHVDGKAVEVKPGAIFTLPEAKDKGGMVFKGYIPASNPGELVSSGEKVTVRSNLTFTSYYVPDEKTSAKDIVFGNFKSYYNCIVDGVDTGYADKNGEFLRAWINPDSTRADSALKLDGWDYGGMRISALEHKYAYVLMKVEGTGGIAPVMNVMRSDVFKSQTSIKSETVLSDGEWCFAEFDISSLSEKLIDGSLGHHVKQIHFLPFGNNPVRSVPANASVYIDKIIFSKEPLQLSLHDRILGGYGDGTFKPDGSITRAEAAALTERIIGKRASENAGSHSFFDVSETDWFYGAVSNLVSLGIVDKDGAFRPDEPITRAELSDMIYRTGIKKADIHKSFPDLYENHRYYETVRKAAGAGIINGYTDGTFRPDNPVTRAEAVRIIANTVGRTAHVEELDKVGVFTDIPDDHWCKDDISELSVRHILYGDKALTTDAASTAIGFNGGVSESLIREGNAKKSEVDRLFVEKRDAILQSPTSVTVSGTKYYVSNDGDDSNDGLSKETPFRTVAKVNGMKLEAGDGVFFRRGDIWREALICAKGVTYSAYGSGEKPRFYGSVENGSGAEKWTLLEGTDNIWRFHRKMRDVGGIVLEGGKDVFEKVVPHFRDGVFYLNAGSEVFDVRRHLVENLTFFSDIPYRDLKGADSFGYVYLRCDGGNPGELFSDLEFITTGYSVYFPKPDTVIDNLCAMYSHGGINGSSTVINATVQNCEVAYIGGNLQGYDVFGGTSGNPTRYGNGINFYGACNGYYVRNNYIHDVYDAGISNQYAAGGSNEIRNDNIEYSGNVIERCCYGIEYFMGKADTYTVRIMTNLDINNNIIRDSGYGFGRTDPSACAAIKGWDHNNHAESFVIRNNIFCNSYAYLYHIGAAYDEWLPTLSGNTYIQRAGALFGRFGKNPTTLFEFNYDVESLCREAMKEPDGSYYFFSDTEG